jgi:hypothetical protein
VRRASSYRSLRASMVGPVGGEQQGWSLATSADTPTSAILWMDLLKLSSWIALVTCFPMQGRMVRFHAEERELWPLGFVAILGPFYVPNPDGDPLHALHMHAPGALARLCRWSGRERTAGE